MPAICSKCRKPNADEMRILFCTQCGGRMIIAAPEPVVALQAAPTEGQGERIVRHLGSGAMGDVYEIERTDGSIVAVKYLSETLAAKAEALAAFREEARTAMALNHPRCVSVLAFEEDPPRIVMERMPGQTLKDVGIVPATTAVRYTLDLIEALVAVHSLGVIHRDVKPGNGFLTADDRVKLGDFGLSSRFDRIGEVPLGTVLFSSPEQLRGESIGFESDQYSLCATLYFLLCGRAPHESTSLTATLAKAMSEPAPPLKGRGANVAPALERAVLKGLERDRDRRWPDLDRLRKALEQFAAEGGGAKRGWLGRLFRG